MSRIMFILLAMTISFTLFSNDEFVRVKNGRFFLNGQDFRFIGSNNYYMHYKSSNMIDNVLESAKDMGIKVLRIWGFLDGENYCREKNTYMHPAPGVFGIPENISGVQDGFERLDYTIKRAKELGIKLIVVLVNNWDDFGGMNQYVKWLNGRHHDDFYRDKNIKEEYKRYVSYIVNRVNIYTGIPYKDEPTIMAWELANEPRCETDKSGETLVEWVKEMSAYIKNLDPNHLVAIGDEGFFNNYEGFEPYDGEAGWTYSGWSGVDWKKLLEIETIDFGTFHLYPSHWGVKPENYAQWGAKWIEDHIKIAKKLGKPVVLEEYGIPKSAPVDRVAVYKLWNDVIYDLGGDGAMFWFLAGVGEGRDKDERGYYPDYDGFRIVNDDSEEAALFRNYTRLFSDGESVRENTALFVIPKNEAELKGKVKVRVAIFDYNGSLKSFVVKIGERVFTDDQMKALGYGIYGITFDTTQLLDGEYELFLKASFGGDVAADTVGVKIVNKARYVLLEKVDFSNPDEIKKWWNSGTWQAEFEKPDIEWSNVIGEGSLRVNVKLSGKNDWEEVRVARNFEDLFECEILEYDIYIPDLEDLSGRLRPYAVLNPGWVKIGLDKNIMNYKGGKIVLFNGQRFRKFHVKIEFNRVSGVKELHIGVVGDHLKYEGPIYIDNIRLYKKGR
ncbi:cellulase family glycosylhydrolase [Thermotoga sp. KOL6]|uniref:cellulase family glycosylhydrolase n=1 Tax=Thermotoga sp. KOL6 TaxID=126741 RepID=UPI000C77F9BD|nr:cellulase family glycosylhydrolase [Thermotoga sp. KOL6]PLV59946.1 beta-mannosidase [Thermotoga sp. KOL6]